MADGFDWLDLLPELVNIVIATTFLVLFLVRMRRLTPLAEGSRFNRMQLQKRRHKPLRTRTVRICVYLGGYCPTRLHCVQPLCRPLSRQRDQCFVHDRYVDKLVRACCRGVSDAQGDQEGATVFPAAPPLLDIPATDHLLPASRAGRQGGKAC